ncbi:uncharacterized protein LOC112540069 isoform X2 [Python bivittatus]|nr:uncharacterized protein LOC112540069 isoform X2 [Python bivittatus]
MVGAVVPRRSSPSDGCRLVDRALRGPPGSLRPLGDSLEVFPWCPTGRCRWRSVALRHSAALLVGGVLGRGAVARRRARGLRCTFCARLPGVRKPSGLRWWATWTGRTSCAFPGVLSPGALSRRIWSPPSVGRDTARQRARQRLRQWRPVMPRSGSASSSSGSRNDGRGMDVRCWVSSPQRRNARSPGSSPAAAAWGTRHPRPRGLPAPRGPVCARRRLCWAHASGTSGRCCGR